jgi:hypothetical protein
MKRRALLDAGGSRLSSQLLRRQRSGELSFEASPGKQFPRPYLKKTFTKNWAGGVAQGEGPEFKRQSHKKRKKDK